MKPFDGNEYRKTLMRAALESGDMPDEFERYALDYSDDDEAAIKGRMAEVLQFWNKDQATSGKYRDLYERLIADHTMTTLILLDGNQRRATATSLRAKADAAMSESLERLERAINSVVASYRGIPPSERALLESLGSRLLLPADRVNAELDRHPAVDEPKADAIPESTRRQIRQTLTALGQATGDLAGTRSLYSFLGLAGADTDPVEVQQHWAALAAANRSRNESDPQKKLVDRLLGLSKAWMIDQPPGVYRAAFREDVREQLEPLAIEAGIDDRRIDELEAQQLLERAIEMGLSQDDARAVLVRLASNLAVSLEFGTAVDYVECGSCTKVFRADQAPDLCTRCGNGLFHPCAGCGERCASSDPVCPSCGFNVQAVRQAERLVDDGRRQLDDGAPATALAAAESALAIVRDDGNAQSLRTAAHDACQRAHESWRHAEHALAERRLYQARDLLAALAREARDIAGPTGAEPLARLSATRARLAEVEAQLTAARRLPQGPQREAALTAVLDQATDCAEAASELAVIPPQPPQSVRLQLTERGVHVVWAPSGSPGAIEYIVKRTAREGAPGGGEVGRTSAAELDDTTAPAGAVVSYGVAAVRAGASSVAARSETLLVAHEVADLNVQEGDGEVALAWAPVTGQGHACIERTELDSGHRALLTPVGSGIRDGDVINGKRYRYRIFVEYRCDGEPIETAGVEAFVAPLARPQAVHDLETRATPLSVDLRWTEPVTGSVRVLRCATDPQVPPGSDVDPADLGSIGTALPAHDKGARDLNLSDRVVWYLPITLAGNHAVVGEVVRHVVLPEIAGVRAVDLTSAVRITWEWPAGCSAAVVAWRGDRQPVGPHDPDASLRSITQAEYRNLGGVEIDLPPSGSLFIAVYPSARIDGELLHGTTAGPDARAVLRRTAQTEVRYDVRRTGLRKRRVELEATSDGPVPALVIVARQGDLLPLSPDEGRTVAQIGGDAAASPVARCEIDLKDLGTPTALRAFFATADAQLTHRLLDPNTSDLIFR